MDLADDQQRSLEARGDDLLRGGCVQTGGIGKTWKRYVNPGGPNSDRLYFGSLQIPGIANGLQPLRTAGCRFDAQRADQCTFDFPGAVAAAPADQMFLRLGYADDDYRDNGYSGHDDGTQDQCRNVGNAFVDVTITHGN